MSNPYLSIIIPAYQEAQRLPASLEKVLNYIEGKSFQSEIIVVDDGSNDNTLEVAKQYLDLNIHKVISNGTNKGKGYSVRSGVLLSQGDYILFSDADLSTPIEEMDMMLPYLENGYDVVIGSRALEDKSKERKMLWYREIMGRIYNFLGQLILFPGIRDSQCGFKAFKKESGKKLFQNQKIDGFSFDGEILFLAEREGLKIKELPINWFNADQSKVSLVGDSLKMFLDLIFIRYLHLFSASKRVKKKEIFS